LGYYSNTEKNRQSFIEIKQNDRPLRYYKTGDYAYVDQDGDYMFLGRIDDQFQINGFRVEPGEIESSAYTYGLKNNCIALAYKDKKGNNEIYLFTESSKDIIPALKEFLKEQLPPYMIPKEIIDLDVFPKTAGGKIDRAYFVKFLQERNKTI
jgi:D-alanine--poly(phosphoribitol) ligase subunit 1